MIGFYMQNRGEILQTRKLGILVQSKYTHREIPICTTFSLFLSYVHMVATWGSLKILHLENSVYMGLNWQN